MMIVNALFKENPLRLAITAAYRKDETACVNDLLAQLDFSNTELQQITQTATTLVEGTRTRRKQQGGLDAFLHQYDLSSDEGIALMCLAEALLRIPDTYTIDRLISDKISTAEWKKHLAQSSSLFVNAATWSLLLTGKIYAPTLKNEKKLSTTLARFFSKTSATFIRPIILSGMKIIGKQFVMGRTIEEAIQRAQKLEAIGYRYSYDMLGEGAKTAEDAEIYFHSYQTAIHAIGRAANNQGPIKSPGISIKLSAIHPRYELAKRDRVMEELAPRLLALAQLAKEKNIALTVDAEEADRLDISLDIIEKVFGDPSLQGWEGFGLAVQSYQKRAPFVIDWLIDLSKRHQKKLMVRLIKGAYWDAEIKQSQVLGLPGYPVFTRKNATDVSFIACAKKLLAHPDCFYPMFGTHNAHSVAAVLTLAGNNRQFEFQCLHGMGQPLYDQIVGKDHLDIPCRIYAPVGTHRDLLAYLVRRLLENGANTSFINRIADDDASVEKLIAHPFIRMRELTQKPHPHIPLPENIFGPERKNSEGLDMTNTETLNQLKTEMEKAAKQTWQAHPIINGEAIKASTAKSIYSPIDQQILIGESYEVSKENLESAMQTAVKGQKTWGKLAIAERAAILRNAANLLEKNKSALMTLLSLEGGKQINDALSEVREAIDFCRYYAECAEKDLTPKVLPGPTGEYNELSMHPRGTFLCISPWNFPLAIFLGQVVAALAAGNTVLAKPAEQTSLIATFAVKLLLEAGVPKEALQLLIGRGSVIGKQCTPDERVSGVLFTGSTETAKTIQQTLSERKGPIVPFIAETGGQNAMIVDSSALPEQVVTDVINSAFNSAGQRCSALRVLFLQREIADRVILMLKGAMKELKIGDPRLISTDIGPVIDDAAKKMLQDHFEKMQKAAVFIDQVPTQNLPNGHFFAPAAFELENLNLLEREVFGPILHVIRFDGDKLDEVLDQIIHTGYGLTLGIHSRIDATIEYIVSRMPVGNMYVNRNMIGAVVGVQPFGGERLSGTGPKAGGPHYLPALSVERTLSINTTAAGGNATLVSLSEE